MKEKLNNVNTLIEAMRKKTQELKSAQNEMFDLEKDSGYLLPNGEFFTHKMLLDLRMWKNFADEYGYNSIMKLRNDLEELKKFREKYGNIV